MSALSFAFEGIVAALMVALIVYCIRLERRLAALRQDDAPIRALIGELQAAADRAETAVGHLKAAGLDAERSLQQAIRTAQAVEDDLVRRGRIAAAAPAARMSAAESSSPATSASAPAARREARIAATARQPAARPEAAAGGMPAKRPASSPPASSTAPQHHGQAASRSDAERDLLRAIRFARAEGEA
jgi:hypothetical protein